jgi:RNA polymerase sigma factor (sigma-70 family)
VAEMFDRLVRRHRTEIFRTILRTSRSREEAEDLTQITFLNAYTALQRGAEPEMPRAWLHAIARNAGHRRYREQRFVEVELEAGDSIAVPDDAPTVGELQAALANLTLNQRASLLMREVGGLSATEIGARLGISPGAVATLLFRARRALRAELEAAGWEGPKRSPLGGLATAYLAVLRPLWLRLVAPLSTVDEPLTRTAATLGAVAAAATGAALLTNTAPLVANAERAPIVHATPHVVTHGIAPRRKETRVRVAVPPRVGGSVVLAPAKRAAAAPPKRTPEPAVAATAVAPAEPAAAAPHATSAAAAAAPTAPVAPATPAAPVEPRSPAAQHPATSEPAATEPAGPSSPAAEPARAAAAPAGGPTQASDQPVRTAARSAVATATQTVTEAASTASSLLPPVPTPDASQPTASVPTPTAPQVPPVTAPASPPAVPPLPSLPPTTTTTEVSPPPSVSPPPLPAPPSTGGLTG